VEIAMVTLQIPHLDLERELSKITEPIQLARTRLQATHGWTRLFVTKRFTKLRRRRRAVEARKLENDSTGSFSEAFNINAPKLGGVCTTGLMGWMDRVDAKPRVRAAARLRDGH
jgi:hypothetical protein